VDYFVMGQWVAGNGPWTIVHVTRPWPLTHCQSSLISTGWTRCFNPYWLWSCDAGPSSDAELLQRMQLMEETHRVMMQQMVQSHTNELEKLQSSLQEHQH